MFKQNEATRLPTAQVEIVEEVDEPAAAVEQAAMEVSTCSAHQMVQNRKFSQNDSEERVGNLRRLFQPEGEPAVVEDDPDDGLDGGPAAAADPEAAAAVVVVVAAVGVVRRAKVVRRLQLRLPEIVKPIQGWVSFVSRDGTVLLEELESDAEEASTTSSSEDSDEEAPEPLVGRTLKEKEEEEEAEEEEEGEEDDEEVGGVAWENLSEDDKAAAAVIGWDSDSWGGHTPITETVWAELSEEQRAAAGVLEYDEESWDEYARNSSPPAV